MEEELRNYGARRLEEVTVANKIIGNSTKLLEGPISRVYLRARFPIHSFVVLILLLSALSLGTACGRTSAAPAIPSPEVEVATVFQKDVTIVSEWVATLDGYVNAQIQPQVTGYIIQQVLTASAEVPALEQQIEQQGCRDAATEVIA